MEESKDLWKPNTVGKLAIRLARVALWDLVLIASTVAGMDHPALDDAKLKSLNNKNVFGSTSLTYFMKQIVPQSHCRSVQAFEKHFMFMTAYSLYKWPLWQRRRNNRGNGGWCTHTQAIATHAYSLP